MNKIPKRRITVMSSLNEMSTNQLVDRVVERGEGVYSPPLNLGTEDLWTDI